MVNHGLLIQNRWQEQGHEHVHHQQKIKQPLLMQGMNVRHWYHKDMENQTKDMDNSYQEIHSYTSIQLF